MSRMQRLDNKKGQNLLTAEFTTGQLIALICASLFVALACFGLGIFVARLDPSFGRVVTTVAEEGEQLQTSTKMETYTTPAFGQEATESKNAAQSPAARRTPETPPPRNPYMDNTPRLTALPPLSPHRSMPVQAEAPTRIPTTDASEPVETAAPSEAPPVSQQAPAATPAPETPVLLTPIEPDEPIIETNSLALPQPAAQAPATTPQPPAASGKGQFGIQVAAFSGSNRRTQAESFQKRLLSEQKVDAEIIASDDDAHCRVIVGRFATRESAAAACKELRRKAGLGEAFVRPF